MVAKIEQMVLVPDLISWKGQEHTLSQSKSLIQLYRYKNFQTLDLTQKEELRT